MEYRVYAVWNTGVMRGAIIGVRQAKWQIACHSSKPQHTTTNHCCPSTSSGLYRNDTQHTYLTDGKASVKSRKPPSSLSSLPYTDGPGRATARLGHVATDTIPGSRHNQRCSSSPNCRLLYLPTDPAISRHASYTNAFAEY